MAKLVEAKKLYKEYRNDEEVFCAVDGIDMDFDKGDFLVIAGASGSGKSSLINLLSMVDNPTSGEINYLGKDISKLNDKEAAKFRATEIGYVFQDRNLLNDLTVFQNIAISGYLYNKPVIINERVNALIKAFDIEKQRDKYPNQLSGGQQQRVAIARSLINMPKIIYLDEPTGSLNMSQGERVLKFLTKLNAGGQTIVMVTHDLKAACRGNKLMILKDGRLELTHFIGKYEEEKKQDREKEIYDLLKSRGL
jgi:putative ABC transport system ATP-binding protein